MAGASFLSCPAVTQKGPQNVSINGRCRRMRHPSLHQHPRSCAAPHNNSSHVARREESSHNLLSSEDSFPAYIPQTIEWAMAQAQNALEAALADGLRRIIIELPMGRARKFWTRQAPRELWIRESGVLASHIASSVQGADIRVVLADKCSSDACVHPWIARRHVLRAGTQEDFLGETKESTIVFVVGVSKKHEIPLKETIKFVPDSVPVVLFNCLMDVPVDTDPYPPGFVPTYMCRALKRCAFARYGHKAPYHFYVEIAVFEYEWISDVAEREGFTPGQKSIENSAFRRGAHPTGPEGFYKSEHRGCEAGFWPFMSLAAKYVLPLDGDTYRANKSQNKQNKTSSSSKPFGFF